MALWPSGGQSLVESAASLASTAVQFTVTASATPHTKGSWAQVIASTAREANSIALWFPTTRVAATDSSMLFDIGIGGSGSEVAIVSNLVRGHMDASQTITLPIRIPAGSRVTLRAQSAVVSKAADVAVSLLGDGGWPGLPVGQRATTYGANTATSNAVLLTDTASNNTKASWTEIVASTTNPMRWMVPLIGGDPGDTVWSGNTYAVDIGVGGSGAESAIIENLAATVSTSEGVANLALPPLPVNLPAGTRLAGRFQQANGAGESLTMSIVGID
jgi:hypothetical protein